jgi:hypothetical protein
VVVPRLLQCRTAPFFHRRRRVLAADPFFELLPLAVCCKIWRWARSPKRAGGGTATRGRTRLPAASWASDLDQERLTRPGVGPHPGSLVQQASVTEGRPAPRAHPRPHIETKLPKREVGGVSKILRHLSLSAIRATGGWLQGVVKGPRPAVMFLPPPQLAHLIGPSGTRQRGGRKDSRR